MFTSPKLHKRCGREFSTPRSVILRSTNMQTCRSVFLFCLFRASALRLVGFEVDAFSRSAMRNSPDGDKVVRQPPAIKLSLIPPHHPNLPRSKTDAFFSLKEMSASELSEEIVLANPENISHGRKEAHLRGRNLFWHTYF